MKPYSVVVSLVALTLVASACSGEDTPAPSAVPTTTTTQPPPTTSQPPPTTTQPPPTTTTTTVDPRAGWSDTVVFGYVPDGGLAGREESAAKFAEAIGTALALRVVVNPVANSDAVASGIQRENIDLGALAPTSYVDATENSANLELLAQEVRFGDGTYHAQWFTNDATLCGADPIEGAFHYDENGNVERRGSTDTPAQQTGWNSDDSRDEAIEAGLACPAPVDLSVAVGRTIAFTDETSPQGFLVPTLELMDLGITKDQYTSIFTGSHNSAVEAVYDGTADIGVSFDDARRFVPTHPDVGTRVIVFNITSRIPNDVIAVRANLPGTLKEALLQTIAEYASTLEGQTAIDTLFGWTALMAADAATVQSLETISRLNAAFREAG